MNTCNVMRRGAVKPLENGLPFIHLASSNDSFSCEALSRGKACEGILLILHARHYHYGNNFHVTRM